MSKELSSEDFDDFPSAVSTPRILSGMEVTFNPISPDFKEFEGVVGTVLEFVDGYSTRVIVDWHDQSDGTPFHHNTYDLIPKHDNHTSMMVALKAQIRVSQPC